MALRYKIVKQAEPGKKGGGEYKYYLRSAGRELITVDQLSEKLAGQTSLNKVDVKMVLFGLSTIIPDLLLDNYSVELGELGIFSVDLKSEASATPEEATWRKVRDLKVNFRVGNEIKKKVKGASFQRMKG